MQYKLLRALLLALFLLASPALGQAQGSNLHQDQDHSGPLLDKTLSLGGVGLTHAALYTWTYFAWYRGRSLSQSLVWRDEGGFGMNTYAGGADKLGHMFSNYALTRGTTQILRSGGWGPWTSRGISAGLTLAFFTTIEIKDGFHQNFGFSWGDMTFNGLGIGLATLMEAVPWVDRHFDFRLEYVPTELFLEQLMEEGVVNSAEDYSGQTFLLAHHLRAHQGIRDSQHLSWLRYVDVVAGFGSRNYLPKPKDPTKLQRQEVFLGASLNVQEVIDQVLFPRQEQRHGAGYGALRFGTEILAVPYTTLPVLDDSRSSAQDLASDS